MEYGDNGDIKGNWYAWNYLQRLDKGAKKDGNQSRRGDHPNYSITEIGQNTEKSPRDLKGLAITQTTVKAHQQTLI